MEDLRLHRAYVRLVVLTMFACAMCSKVHSPPMLVTPLNNLQDMFTHGNGFLECGMGGRMNPVKGCEPTNSTTQAKFLGTMNSVDGCIAACRGYRYRGVFPCRSFVYFHHDYGNSSTSGWRSLCYARIDDAWLGGAGPVPSDGAVTSGLLTDVPDCETADQCERNGQCIMGKCACAQGWTGRFCQTLALLPARKGSGYHRENTASWGGSIIPPDVSGLDKYQMFAAEFDLHCGFNAWYKVSRVIRASSTTAEGPYEFQEEVIPMFAHGPAVAVIPPTGSGGTPKFALIHTGNGTGAGTLPPALRECTNGTTPAGAVPGPSYTECGKPTSVRTRLLVADSVLGPWVNNTEVGCGDENPSPLILDDGSLLMLNRFGSHASDNWCTACPGRYGEIYRASAPSWNGPFEFVPRQLFPGCADPCVEDSNVYRVQNPPNKTGRYANTQVGSIHAIFHGRTHRYQGPGYGQMPAWSGRHAWSNDSRGETWFMSPYAAFSSFVPWQSGGNSTFSTRERPHILWQSGLMTHLSSGVESGTANCLDCSERGRNRVDDYSYTLVQPIDVSP